MPGEGIATIHLLRAAEKGMVAGTDAEPGASPFAPRASWTLGRPLRHRLGPGPHPGRLLRPGRAARRHRADHRPGPAGDRRSAPGPVRGRLSAHRPDAG